MIKRRVKEFWKSAISLVVMALSDNFTVAASKCRSDGKHHKVANNDDSQTSASVLQIGHLLDRNQMI